MTKQHFTRMKQAAAELVRLARAGAEVDPDTLTWAEAIVSHNAPAPPFKPSPNQAKILELLDDAPLEGLTSQKISAGVPEIDKQLLASTLWYMSVRTKVIASLRRGRENHYFRNEAALELGRPLVMAEAWRSSQKRKARLSPAERQELRETERAEKKRAREQAKLAKREQRLAEKEAAKKAKRDAWGVRNKPKPTPKQNITIKARPNVTIAPPKPAPDIRRSVFIPEDFPITKLPSGRDTRFDVDPNAEGAGFSAEWRRLRAPKD